MIGGEQAAVCMRCMIGGSICRPYPMDDGKGASCYLYAMYDRTRTSCYPYPMDDRMEANCCPYTIRTGDAALL